MSKAIFERIEAGLATQGEEIVKKTKAIIAFNIKDLGDAGQWVLNLKEGKGSVKNEKAAKADATIEIAEKDFIALAEGKLNGAQAFMQGKLKIKGNMMIAQKLGGVLEAAK